MKGGIIGLLVGAASGIDVPGLEAFVEYNFQNCPIGTVRKHNRCVRNIAYGYVDSCPSGNYFNATECLAPALGTIECPAATGGISLFKTQYLSCEYHETKGTIVSCPPGFILQDGRCIQTLSIPSQCPVGSFEDASGVCYKTTLAALVCPSQFTLVDGVCIQDTNTPALSLCPTNSTNIGGGCAVSGVLAQICPDGFALAITPIAACVRTSAPEPYCVEGSLILQNPPQCVVELTTPPAPFCPPPATLVDGTCVWITPYPTDLVCEGGAFFIDGQCASYNNTKAELECPVNYVLQRGVCVNTYTYDCSTVHYECDPSAAGDITVRKESKLPDDIVPSHLRHVVPMGKPASLLNNEILAHTVHEVHDYCPKVAVVSQKACTGQKTAEPVPFCNVGTFNGEVCVSQILTPPVPVCGATTDATGGCVLEERFDPQWQCGNGTLLTSVGKHELTCESFRNTDATWKCPRGQLQAVPGGPRECVEFTSPVCPGGGCPFEAPVSGYLKCSTGFVLLPDGTCLKKTIETPSYRCGGAPSTAPFCLTAVPAVNGTEIAVAPKEVGCNLGFAHEGGKCVATTFQDGKLLCKGNDILTPFGCARPSPLVDFCQSGFEKNDTNCLAIARSTPLAVTTPVMKTNKTPDTNFVDKLGLGGKLIQQFAIIPSFGKFPVI